MNRKGRRKHCRSNDKCHFAFEAFTVKMAWKCSKTDSNSQNVAAALKLEPRESRSPKHRTCKERFCSPGLPPRKAIKRGGQGPPSLGAVLLHSDIACHLSKERKIKQEDGVGAVTSTVCFLLNSVTLGQVKAGTSSFIALVLTYLSTRCSVCV